MYGLSQNTRTLEITLSSRTTLFDSLPTKQYHSGVSSSPVLEKMNCGSEMFRHNSPTGRARALIEPSKHAERLQKVGKFWF